jgi:hypothetical protein
VPRWTPEPKWKGQDAFIIGGGPSLREFNWARLHAKNTIGCNTAFTLGPRVCKVCFFSDISWFDRYGLELEGFAGPVVTHSPELACAGEHEWVRQVPREDFGLHLNALGYGGNSGCGAINLALLMGAQRVFLLGFDCQLPADRRPNWHDRVHDVPSDDVYTRFYEGFTRLAQDLPRVFPGRQVINLTEGSRLTQFPQLPLDSILL